MEPALRYELEKWEQQAIKCNASFDDSRKVSLPNFHPHELVYNSSIPNHRCDVCQKGNLTEGYRCRQKECDFDVCLSCCADQTRKTSH